MQTPPIDNHVRSASYRPDIDGLRAVAVLSVIVFHIDASLLPGGFVGVDIFFVISGYLISLHIFQELRDGRFSIAEFYRRRIKRIAPTMLAVVLVVTLASQVFLRPWDAEKVAESALWSLLSMANVYFWLFEDTSYFAEANNQKPLLHLWSLGVEEQFYIFWPLLLLLLKRVYRRATVVMIFAVACVASFLLGEALFAHDASFVYYMLPTRAGELLVGALLAYAALEPIESPALVRLSLPLALSGAALLLGSLFLLSEHDVFPGIRALPPTVGTALLILAGHAKNRFSARVLGSAPLVWVGLVSYSAYLWHWPVIAFYRYGNPEISAFAGVVLFSLSMFLAAASYTYIEVPARRSKRSAMSVLWRQFVLPCGALGVLVLTTMKLDGYGLRWFTDDYQTRLAAVRDAIVPPFHHDYVCQRQLLTSEDTNDPRCVLGSTDAASPQAILWGDSNAAHYVGILGVLGEEGGFSFRNLEVGGCPPLASDASDFVYARRAADCADSRALALGAVSQFDVVIISASWTLYHGRGSGFMDAFSSTIRSLAGHGKLVILIGEIPTISTYDRLCREKAISYPFMDCSSESVPIASEVVAVNDELRRIAAATENVEYHDFNEYLCTRELCSAFDDDGKLRYHDSTHLTMDASWAIGREVYEREGVPFPFSLIPERREMAGRLECGLTSSPVGC